MAHGGSWPSPMRLSAVELQPSKGIRTNIPNRRRKFLSVEARVASYSFTRTMRTEAFFAPSGHFHSMNRDSIQRSHRGGSILL